MTNNDVSVAENPHVLPNPHYITLFKWDTKGYVLKDFQAACLL